MIRGVEGVIRASAVVVGGVYLDPGSGRGTTLFQWIRTGETREGSPAEAMLILSSDIGESLGIQNYLTDNGLVKMPPVGVRVDPPSALGTAMNLSLAAGMFLIDEDRPIVVAKAGYSGYRCINLATGLPVRPTNYWVAFSTWSIVVDEAGEEISIATFGAGAAV